MGLNNVYIEDNLFLERFFIFVLDYTVTAGGGYRAGLMVVFLLWNENSFIVL
ncbi:hypothetical protein J2S13_002813 [Oikeobacillus pervagus]|uniref:Uncharacterized protein n=1 Tax=Oikeobacillus pervagus TaxID=1325931 RepID=A0AAJ1T0I2_9BACI|nr:hypothetical protein [Oikeobacillus pervagus]